MKTRKIALFLPSLYGGGAERVMLNLARGFIEKGLQVDLVLARFEGAYLNKVPSQVRVIDLDKSRMIKTIPDLVHYLRHEKPYAMLSAMGHTNVVAILAKRIANSSTKIIVTNHNPLTLSSKNANDMRIRTLPLLMRLFYPMADSVIAVSNGVAIDLARNVGLPLNKITVINNPIVTPELIQKAKEPVNHPWFLPGNPPVILGAGRLTKAKDFPTLIQAFALLRKNHLAKLIILGEGEKRKELTDLCIKLGISRDVDMPGFVDNPYKYMARSSLFVLSSAWEGFGNVLVEAMAVGTPVISTDCPCGPTEILQNGKLGQLVPVGDSFSLQKAMENILSNNAPKINNNNVNRFTLFHITEQYLEVLN